VSRTERERPCIHVALLPDVDADLYRWVAIGAEEEGVPCRRVEAAEPDLVGAAYAAARSSRFNVGVAVSADGVALHESHMPPPEPVLTFRYSQRPQRFCRLMGCNAARMIIRKPFRFEEEIEEEGNTAVLPPPPQPAAPSPTPATAAAAPDAQELKTIITSVIRILQERGLI
jgi:hypothetical protein